MLYRTFEEESKKPLSPSQFDNDCYKWYYAIRGVELFNQMHNRYPGEVRFIYTSDAIVLERRRVIIRNNL